MSLIEALPAASALEGMLLHRPELLEKFRTFYGSFRADGLVPGRILELCRLRVAHIHGCDAEFNLRDPAVELDEAAHEALRKGEVASFAPAEQAALALAEQMPFGHHQISDELVSDADAALGHAGCVALLTALAFFDVSCRLKTVLEVPAETQQSPSF